MPGAGPIPLFGGPFQCVGGGFCSHGAAVCDDGGLKPEKMIWLELVSYLVCSGIAAFFVYFFRWALIELISIFAISCMFIQPIICMLVAPVSK